MDEQRIQAYFNLINQLLTCPSRQESEILRQNSQLVDEGFLQAANYYAQKLQEDGQEQLAVYLSNFVRQLSQGMKSAPLNRQQAYLQLIQALLQCPDGEEGQILEANQELIDAGLIEMMQQVAAKFDRQGNSNGNWLRNIALNLTQSPNNSQPSQGYLDFLLEVLGAVSSGAGQEQVYLLFLQNLNKLNLNLVQALQTFTEKNLLLEAEQQQAIWHIITQFSNLISQFPLGSRHDNLEIAIAGYEILLTIYNHQDFLIDWAGTQNNLGIVYRERIKGNKADNIERAIHAYKQALTIRTKQKLPIEWAMTQNNLGTAYRQRIKGDKADNIERAIHLYEETLTIHTQQEFPLYWAMTQNNLGLVYRERIKGDKADNIERAIHAYKQALTVRTEQEFPVDWAMTQNNLGMTYGDRIKGDRVDNIERAIHAYKQALTIYTQQEFPLYWAMTQNNLGFIYKGRIKGDRADNIERAIYACKQALIVRTEQELPVDWAITQNNLGAAYSNRIKGDEADNVERAIQAYEKALTIHTRKKFPLYWADTQNNLGVAYRERIKGDKADNVEKAIHACEKALTIYIQKEFPTDWAITQNNLGSAYSERIKGDKADNIERAIQAYEEALTIHTIQSDPIRCLLAANNLGVLHLKESSWQLAINAYTIAIQAVEQSREWASNDHNKQEIISNAIEVYQNIVQACINLGQIDKAIEYVERGKARNLVDLLSTRDLYPKGDIPQEVISRLDYLRKEVTAEKKRIGRRESIRNSFSIRDGRDRNFAGGIDKNEALDRTRLNSLRQELDKLVKEEIKDSSFQLTQKVEPISFEEIKEALPTEQTVLIEWYIGNNTLSAFIVTRQQPIPVHLEYTEKQFQALFEIANQYYGLYRRRDRQWHRALPGLLAQLAQNLQIEIIIEQIKQVIPNYDRLILVPHRWLHLLPIHALPLTDSKCLLDLFPEGVSYAPSVQLLELTQKQVRTYKEEKKFFAVQNPTEDLEFTNIEVQSIRTQFQPHDDVLIEKQATKSTLLNQATLGQANLAHFSCHGYFNFENPELSALLMAGSKVDKEEREGEDKEDGVEKKRFLPSRDGGNIDLEQCLTLGEIFGLDLRNCHLVTLSACETGLTDFKSLSDEYIGLPSGFLYAGSPSVVSSLWAVSDLSTTFLMIKFYQNLQEIDSVPIALNQAQLWLRSLTRKEFKKWSKDIPLTGDQRFEIDGRFRQNEHPFASPYHWGAFCAVGS